MTGHRVILSICGHRTLKSGGCRWAWHWDVTHAPWRQRHELWGVKCAAAAVGPSRRPTSMPRTKKLQCVCVCVCVCGTVSCYISYFLFFRCLDHITDALVSLHGLLLSERIVYKIPVQSSSRHPGLGPLARAADLSGRRDLRSVSTINRLHGFALCSCFGYMCSSHDLKLSAWQGRSSIIFWIFWHHHFSIKGGPKSKPSGNI